MNDGINSSYKKIVEQEFPGFVQTLESCMSFGKRGFRQTFYVMAPEFAPSLIYDSDSCRVRFIWLRGDIRDGGYPTMSVRYGRLHALDNHRFILWNEQLSHCWHRIDLALNFLDGMTPQEAVEKRNEWPTVMDQFIQANKGHNWSHIEWTARTHAAVWEYYGNRLFGLFDLRYLDLFDQYMLFIKQFYKLNPGPIDPSQPWSERIC